MFKIFTDNTLLTAQELNDYLMRQSVIRVANAAERDALPSPQDGMTVWRDDLAATETYANGQWGPAWTEYTPNLTNINPGGGTAVGYYRRSGRLVDVDILITLGTGFSLSAGFYIDTPIPPATRYPTRGLLGHCTFLSGSTAIQGYADRSGLAARLWVYDGRNPSGTTPLTFAAGGRIQAALRYEVDS